MTFEPTASRDATTRVGLPEPEGIELVGSGFDDNGPIAIDAGPRIFPTVTDIIRWPSEVVRDEPFTIGGIVETLGGAPVGGMEVEIFVNEFKANGGLLVGSGVVENGRYTIEVSLPRRLNAGSTS